VSEEQQFLDLVGRVRAGDEEAAAELVRAYQPEVRRLVRVRLERLGLQHLLDSVDVCQSVLGAFFARVPSAEWDLATPRHLLKLLVTMALNKVRDHARRQRVGALPRPGGEEALALLADPAPGPVRALAARDFLAVVRDRLSDEERYLADERAGGREWGDLAGELGSTPDALRKRLARALARVTGDMRPCEVEDE
jgi:RNA polymerase sigma-70 factor (ECF subfamily)